MNTYERLNLTSRDPEHADHWRQETYTFWRNKFRRSGYSEQTALEIQGTLDDIVRYCHMYPGDATLYQAIPDVFIQYTSGKTDALPAICSALNAIVRTGAVPTSVAMLSNWVSLIEYETQLDNGAASAKVLRDAVGWLTEADAVHPWDAAIVFMATHLTHTFGTTEETEQLAFVAAKDTNLERMATRLMTVMEHTKVGPLWWKSINTMQGGSSEAPLPALPVAHDIVLRKDRANQAWWRFGHEMKLTPEYTWVKLWLNSLVCPDKDETFSTNGLL